MESKWFESLEKYTYKTSFRVGGMLSIQNSVFSVKFFIFTQFYLNVNKTSIFDCNSRVEAKHWLKNFFFKKPGRLIILASFGSAAKHTEK
jgi:hypothetical protein